MKFKLLAVHGEAYYLFRFHVPIEKFAQLTGRSLAGFKREFQKTFDTSPRQWLQEKRLEEAYFEISKKGKKPTLIYLDLRFESVSHFSKTFKQKFGIAPTDILKMSAFPGTSKP